MRKFAYNQASRQRTKNRRFNNWVHSNPLWILEGAGQLENLLTTWNRQRTIRRFNNWVHSNPLWILEGAGQ